MKNDYYELRYIETNSIKSGSFSLFDDLEDRITLLDFLEKKDRILLLGNPGVGKSTELEVVFNQLWQNIDVNQEIPIFLNLKNFRLTTTIEDLILDKEWTQLPSVIFIFDGLDEIAAIQNFISELEIFMAKYQKLKIKYILSCRTNIYEKYLIDISGFQITHLKYLSVDQIKSILKNKFDLDISFEEIHTRESILQTPFNLDLFAEYYLENGGFPSTIEESWALFISKEVAITKEKLIKRFTVTESKIISVCKKVAVVNELMQQNIISEIHLYELLGDRGIDIFQEIPFIEKKLDSNNFTFRHKNFQEYFAAKYIADLDSADIIQFIKAKDLDKIKPSMFNTTTFLLNILIGDKFTMLKDWLFDHDLEILFFADDNRLDESFRNNIFEQYYEDQCINKTFWLANNGKIKIDVLAKFAKFEFLITEISNQERLERNRISLTEVISYKILTTDQNEIVKNLFTELVKSESAFFQSEVLRAVKRMNIHHEDFSFWNQLLQFLHPTIHDEVSHQLISIIGSLEDNSQNNKYFIEIVKSHFSRPGDRVIRGTEQIIGNKILTTNDSKLLLELFKLLFTNNYSIRLDSIYSNDFKIHLIQKVKDCSEVNNDFKEELLIFCFEDEGRLMTNEFLNELISEIGLTTKDILDVFNLKIAQTGSLYSLCRFFTKESIDYIVEAYSEGRLVFNREEDIQSVRNWMSHYKLQLALYWQKKFIEKHFVFSEPLLNDQDREKKIKEFNEFKLYNFSLLFNKEFLQKEIEKYFEKYDLEEITQPEFRKVFYKWYDETGYHGLLYTVHTTIEKAFRRFSSIDIRTVIDLLDDEYFYLSLTKSILTHNSANSFNLSDGDQKHLNTLTEVLESKIDYSNVIVFNSENTERFSTTRNFEFIKLLLFFDLKFNIQRSKNFYINVLEYGNWNESHGNENSSFINFSKSRIIDLGGSPEEINQKVTDNINNKILIYYAQKDHIEYAIENNLEETFSKIGENIIHDKFLFDQFGILENYLVRIDDPLSFLKSCCSDINSYICWQAVKLIKEKYHDDIFILEIAKNYLANDEINFLDKAMNILFYLNQEDALYHYDKILDKMIANRQGDASGILPKDFANYTQTTELHFLEPLFDKIFADVSDSSFYLHQSREFLRILVANLSRSSEESNILLPILSKIKNNVDSESFQEFHINQLIDISENSFLKQKSKKMEFEDVLKIFK